jgi:hypothetical protein
VNWEPLEKVANAVLYEGFLLYPYRKSSVKNQQRWHFGTLGPFGGSDPAMMQTQCLIQGDDPSTAQLKIRFLQGEIEREVELSAVPARGEFSFTPIKFAVEVESDRLADSLFRLTIRIVNTGSSGSMLSTHTMLSIRDGAFVSLLDPPEQCREAAHACRNI